MSEIKIANLNPKAWGLTLRFKMISSGEPREVNFKDGSAHKVAEHLVGDETGTILLGAWDEKIKKFKPGKVYEVTELRINVFMNRMKLNMTRKSEIKEIKEDIKVDKSVNVSEKRVEQPRTSFKKYKSNYK